MLLAGVGLAALIGLSLGSPAAEQDQPSTVFPPLTHAQRPETAFGPGPLVVAPREAASALTGSESPQAGVAEDAMAAEEAVPEEEWPAEGDDSAMAVEDEPDPDPPPEAAAYTAPRPPPRAAAAPPPPPPNSTTSSVSVAPPPPPQARPPSGTLHDQLLAAHNLERSRAGMASFQVDGGLASLAQRRANDMATRGYFSHTSPSGETAFSLLQASGIYYTVAGENLARNMNSDAETVSVAMAGLMASSGHRANILNPTFRRVGIGVAYGGSYKYFVMIYAGP